MGKIETATQWMINLAADDTHGYSQDNRWGPDYDCSSAIITDWETAGVPVKRNDAKRDSFCNCLAKITTGLYCTFFISSLQYPDVGTIKPAKIFIVVDFPAPFKPIYPSISPFLR